MERNQRGFTLIEVMIVVAVIAILAAVAFPSYQKHVAKAKRNAAQAVMQTIVSRQEQHMLNARSYFPAGGGDNSSASQISAALGVTIPAEVQANYTITVTSDNVGTPPVHSVKAAPKSPQNVNDSACGTLTLNSTGAKGQSGGAATCW